MRAGTFRHRVTIQSLGNEQPDGHGGFTPPTPTIVAARVPAVVEPLTGRELERAMQIDPRASLQVSLRFRNDVTVRHQVVFHDPDRGDRTLEIAHLVNPMSDRRELQLLCKEAQ